MNICVILDNWYRKHYEQFQPRTWVKTKKDENIKCKIFCYVDYIQHDQTYDYDYDTDGFDSCDILDYDDYSE